MTHMSRNSIKIVRFKNGDTLICGFAPFDDFYSYVEKPMQITSMPIVTKKGVERMTIFMQDWLEYSKDTVFKIPNDVLLLVANPEDEMVEEYFDALEKNELHRIQEDFEKISKNYDWESDEEEDDNSPNIGYNKNNKSSQYDEDEDYDEEEEDPNEDGIGYG